MHYFLLESKSTSLGAGRWERVLTPKARNRMGKKLTVFHSEMGFITWMI